MPALNRRQEDTEGRGMLRTTAPAKVPARCCQGMPNRVLKGFSPQITAPRLPGVEAGFAEMLSTQLVHQGVE